MKNILVCILFFLVAQPAFAFRVDGLAHPESVIVDPATGIVYVSGHTKAKGFIWKIDASGKLQTFIESGKKGITLHAPIGLALSGNQLYVADGGALRRFDKVSGNLLGVIDLSGIGGKSLQGLAFGNDGQLFASDGLANAIYKIDTRDSHNVSIVVKSPSLGHPTGITYDVPRKRLVVLTKKTRRILSVGLDGKITALIDGDFKELTGVDWDRQGNLLVSDKSAGVIYRIRNFSTREVLRQNILTPAGIAFDYAHNRVLVPSSKGNLVFSLAIKR